MTVDVHDLSGRRVRRIAGGVTEPGRYAEVWDGRDERGSRVPAGVYFVRVAWRSGHDSLKLMLIE